jgi:hypothetical protein
VTGGSDRRTRARPGGRAAPPPGGRALAPSVGLLTARACWWSGREKPGGTRRRTSGPRAHLRDVSAPLLDPPGVGALPEISHGLPPSRHVGQLRHRHRGRPRTRPDGAGIPQSRDVPRAARLPHRAEPDKTAPSPRPPTTAPSSWPKADSPFGLTAVTRGSLSTLIGRDAHPPPAAGHAPLAVGHARWVAVRCVVGPWCMGGLLWVDALLVAGICRRLRGTRRWLQGTCRGLRCDVSSAVVHGWLVVGGCAAGCRHTPLAAGHTPSAVGPRAVGCTARAAGCGVTWQRLRGLCRRPRARRPRSPGGLELGG